LHFTAFVGNLVVVPEQEVVVTPAFTEAEVAAGAKVLSIVARVLSSATHEPLVLGPGGVTANPLIGRPSTNRPIIKPPPNVYCRNVFIELLP
jgi:hypothetical protein